MIIWDDGGSHFIPGLPELWHVGVQSLGSACPRSLDSVVDQTRRCLAAKGGDVSLQFRTLYHYAFCIILQIHIEPLQKSGVVERLHRKEEWTSSIAEESTSMGPYALYMCFSAGTVQNLNLMTSRWRFQHVSIVQHVSPHMIHDCAVSGSNSAKVRNFPFSCVKERGFACTFGLKFQDSDFSLSTTTSNLVVFVFCFLFFPFWKD